MTVITWSFEGVDGTITVEDSKERVVLSNGEITVNMPQAKMVKYLEWILQQELKHG